MEKQQRTVVKARKREAIDYSNEIFWFFYLMLHVFFRFKQPNTQPKFDRIIKIIHNLTKNKAWYTFNQKLCFNFQPGTLRIINFRKL
jgi:hypothetical protein